VIKLNIFGITWKQVFDNLTREALKFVSILVFRIGHKGGGGTWQEKPSIALKVDNSSKISH